jgi:CubicO group peptidase (beta-lactamase class C family)
MRIEIINRDETGYSRSRPFRIPSFCFLGLLLTMVYICTAQRLHAQVTTSGLSLNARMDARFADWNKRTSPGCAIAIVKNGKIVYQRGYGMANLEYGIRNTPATIFHVASIAKQFTAFAIHLLAQEGKLSLDDDVRKYLPELHDFGQTITLRHLLHHTSGLRDQFDLLQLAGWRLSDVITEQDVLHLIWRQRELNFSPGTEYLYCNTDYTLLGLIVERVSGRSLREFAQERIFKPLGMKHTQFHDDYQTLVKDRAYSYQWRPETDYRNVPHSYSIVGPSGLFTTVEDLALWDKNFYDGRVGGQTVLTEMLEVGRLASGKELDYASGLVIGEYRGLKTVEHGGSDAGFRADLLRFPEERVSIIFLANADVFNGDYMARQVADIYLEDQLSPLPVTVEPSPPPTPREIKLDSHLLDLYVGDYELRPKDGVFLMITKENGRLMFQIAGQDKFPLFPSSDRDFFMKDRQERLTFADPKEGEGAPSVVLHASRQGIRFYGKPDTTLQRKPRPVLTEELIREYTGDYYCEELGVLYTVTARDG